MISVPSGERRGSETVSISRYKSSDSRPLEPCARSIAGTQATISIRMYTRFNMVSSILHAPRHEPAVETLLCDVREHFKSREITEESLEDRCRIPDRLVRVWTDTRRLQMREDSSREPDGGAPRRRMTSWWKPRVSGAPSRSSRDVG